MSTQDAYFGYDPPATGTDAEMLALVRRAIATILRGGQAYGADGTSLTRANLRDLRWLEKEYRQQIEESEDRSGIAVNHARLSNR